MKATEKEERVGWGGLGPNCMQMRAPNRSGAGHANEAPPPVEYLVLFCLFVCFFTGFSLWLIIDAGVGVSEALLGFFLERAFR